MIIVPKALPEDLLRPLVADIRPMNWHAGDVVDAEYGAQIERN